MKIRSSLLVFLSLWISGCGREESCPTHDQTRLSHPDFNACIVGISENSKSRSCIGSQGSYSGDFTVSDNANKKVYSTQVIYMESTAFTDHYRIRVFIDREVIEELNVSYKGEAITIFRDSTVEMVLSPHT